MAQSQPVGSLMTIVMVAGMCVAVLLSSGRAEGARAEVVAGIDSAGTRTIVVRAEPGAGLNTQVLDRLTAIDGIAWAAGFGASVDVTNIAVPGRDPVSLRHVYGDRLFTQPASDVARRQSVITEDVNGSKAARRSERGFATVTAATRLGLADNSGTVSDADALTYTITGALPERQELDPLGPVVLIPTSVTATPQDLSVLIVVSTRPDLVAAVSDAVKSVLSVDDPAKVTVETSQRLAEIRAQVDEQFGAFGRALLLVIFSLMSLFVAAILYGTVLLRRKDFGRRRALGASQYFIFLLVITQTALTCVAAAVLADAVSVCVILLLSDPLPRLSFVIALNILAISLGVMSAALPALAAARRDPLKELRVA